MELETKIGSKRLFGAVAVQFGGWDDFIASCGDGASPLHHLLPSAEPDFIQYLLARFDIHRVRHDGRYPIETVMDNLPEVGRKSGIVQVGTRVANLRALLAPEIFECINDSGRDVWTQFCTVSTRGIDAFLEFNANTLVKDLAKVLIDNGALVAYESRYLESGVLPLIDATLGIHKESLDFIWPAIRMIIQKSGLLDRAAKHPSVRRLADLLLEVQAVEKLVFLFDHGVDPCAICEGHPRPLINSICDSRLVFSNFQALVKTINKERSEKDTPKGDIGLLMLSNLVGSKSYDKKGKIK